MARVPQVVAGMKEGGSLPTIPAAKAKRSRARGDRARGDRARPVKPRSPWLVWCRAGIEIIALLSVALVGVIGGLGYFIDWCVGTAWLQLLPFAGAVLGLALVTALLLRGWSSLRRRLVRRMAWSPAVLAVGLASASGWLAMRPEFQHEVISLRTLVGGQAEAERAAIGHQVYAAYRRSDLAELERVLDRARVYEQTVHEAAAAFNVDPEVLMGVAAAESAFYPRDSRDGGRGLFQITAPPKVAVVLTEKRLGVKRLDPLNQRHNAYVAAATLKHYLADMRGDLFLGLLAYNIGPRNGGLRSIMSQYGAHDFVTIQPYLQHFPRDYPIRVLAAALAYRLWRTEGKLPRYEDGDNARRVQSVGIPGLRPTAIPRS